MSEAQRIELAPGYSIATIINGCWQLAPDHGGGPASGEQTLRIFSELLERGFTTFDCADIYAGTEELLGRFRSLLADPDSVQVHTKYVPDRALLSQLSTVDVDNAVERSLRRLKVDRLDLVQFHWWSYDVPGCDLVAERLMHAQQTGKIRLLGVTNFDTPHIRQFIDDGVPIVSLHGGIQCRIRHSYAVLRGAGRWPAERPLPGCGATDRNESFRAEVPTDHRRDWRLG
jgi:aryl-alcohol dehydrogenase-like predicted oxidoreductase